jgi:hypothetical protein
MRHRYSAVMAVALAAVLLAACAAHARVFVSDQFGQYIFHFSPGETSGVIVNPDAPLPGIEDLELDSQGRLLIAQAGNVVLFDPSDQSVVRIDEAAAPALTYATYPDGASSDIYLVRMPGAEPSTDVRATSPPELQYLPEGVGPAQTAVVFGDSDLIRDVQVWPFGERAGNILVLSVSPPFMAEVERTGPATFRRLANLFDTDHVNLRGFSITRGGDILVIDFNDGMFRVEHGELIPYGEPVGPGLQDITVGADGTIYITDSYDNVIHRFEANGTLIHPPLGEGQLATPRALVAAGFTPTPAGENVPTNPADHLEILFEEIVQGGFTAATTAPSTERVSPGGNFLPDYVVPPGGGEQFIYFDVGTESVYSRLIQVEIWMEGSRMFFAHGTQDTFRDVTIEGAIDDARGTVPRFGEILNPDGMRSSKTVAGDRSDGPEPSEFVLVEDTRPLTTVVEYKFDRLSARVKSRSDTGTEECPDAGFKLYRKPVRSAKQMYGRGDLDGALAALSEFNATVRANAGWCTPDTYPNNVAGELLALSKTLMFSIEQLTPPAARNANHVTDARLSLSVTSPVSDASRIELTGPAGTKVAARIYSASGRLVSTLFEGRLDGGKERLAWNGTDAAGRRVSSGVYFVRLETDEGFRSAKVVLIR